MRYCPKCKLRVPAEAAVCTKCGGELRTIGGDPAPVATGERGGVTPPVPPAGSGDAQLLLQLQGLQHQVRRSSRIKILIGLAALALAAIFSLLLVSLYFHHVYQYAALDKIDATPTKTSGEAEILFVRASAGKVEFTRETPGNTETLIDHGPAEFASQASEVNFRWQGPPGDYTLRASYRSGWFVTSKEWHPEGDRSSK